MDLTADVPAPHPCPQAPAGDSGSSLNPAAEAALQARIDARLARVGVIGLGYVGLPLAESFCRAGFPVLGFDTDESKVDRLARGETYIRHIPDATVRRMAEHGFEATARFERLAETDAVLICVPTPLTPTRDPDLHFVTDSVRAVAAHPRPGQLVILESTTYPGTTREVVLPILEEGGRRAGRDFFLAFSPEREDPGDPAHTGSAIPKVVGGLDPASLRLAAALYGCAFRQVVPVSSPEVAEACKILENTYRAVNVALVNELKLLYERMGIDIWEVIEAARTKPFGFHPFYPGPGLGGHCIPIDPFYLTWIARRHGLATRFIELAGEVNSAMPGHVAARVAEALNARGKPVKGSRILLVGVAYKKDVDDTRESPGLVLMDLLLRQGADVAYHDPCVPELPGTRKFPRLRGRSTPLTPETLAALDCLVIVTDHSACDWERVVRHAPLIVDTRNATRPWAALGAGKIVPA